MARKKFKRWDGKRIKRLRWKVYGESQPVFARRINTPVETLRKWEQDVYECGGAVGCLFDRLREDAEAGAARPHPDDVPAALVAAC
jgi:DNA-binding transcriptional regulator YiaG